MNIKIVHTYMYMTTVGYYQVKWFKKQSGFGFATDESGQDIFCHHSDIKIDGYKYLKRGEIVTGVKVDMEGGKTKLSEIRGVSNFPLMCQLDKHEPREP